jgi:hypothetical protein
LNDGPVDVGGATSFSKIISVMVTVTVDCEVVGAEGVAHFFENKYRVHNPARINQYGVDFMYLHNSAIKTTAVKKTATYKHV